MFKVGYTENFGIISFLFIAVALCQDRIIVSDVNLNDVHGNFSEEDEVIPEKLLIRMKDVMNVSDFLRLFIVQEQTVPQNESFSYNGSGTEIRRALSAVPAASIAQPANCQTEQHVVELDKPDNGATLFWPSCVRVRRCGGCCTSKMLACKPTATSILNVTVLKMLYNHQNPDSFESQGTRILSLEQHDRCACMCKERPEDCNSDIHEYRENECRCVCNNPEAAASCDGPKKIWDSKECLCKCRNVRLCSSGRYFNIMTCRCEIPRRSLAIENLNRSSSSFV